MFPCSCFWCTVHCLSQLETHLLQYHFLLCGWFDQTSYCVSQKHSFTKSAIVLFKTHHSLHYSSSKLMILISVKKNWISNEDFQIHLIRSSLWTELSPSFLYFLKEDKMIRSCMDHDNTKQMQINIKVIYFSIGS